MNDDLEDVDRRLRGYAERWRSSVQAAPMPGLTPDRRRRRPHPALLVAGTAAAVSLVVVGVVAGSGDRAGTLPPAATNPAPSSAPSQVESLGPDVVSNGVVPWAPLDPTRPDVPTITVAASPDPSAAAASPACTPTDLRATSSRDGATGGMWVLGVELRAASTGVSCHLEGHPTIRLLDQGRQLNLATTDTPLAHSYQAPALVAPGNVVTLALYWAGWCTDPVQNDRIRIALDDGSIEVDGFGTSPGCGAAGAGSGTSPIGVGSFQPQGGFRPAKVTSAYDGTDARLTTLTDPLPGRTLHFQVTLTAARDIPLDPCPDYTMSQYGSWDDVSVVGHALNCGAVPYHLDDGTPYLPTGVPVTFAMELSLISAEADVPKAIWHLLGTDVRLVIPTGVRSSS